MALSVEVEMEVKTIFRNNKTRILEGSPTWIVLTFSYKKSQPCIKVEKQYNGPQYTLNSASTIRNSWSNLTDVDLNVTKILESLSVEKETWDQMVKTEKGRETLLLVVHRGS